MSPSGRFLTGDAVAVRRLFPPGHVRTPWYVRGKSGVIERVLEAFPNPEERAYGRSGLPATTLYRVRFRQTHVWSDYKGQEEDTVDIELFENWLVGTG